MPALNYRHVCHESEFDAKLRVIGKLWLDSENYKDVANLIGYVLAPLSSSTWPKISGLRPLKREKEDGLAETENLVANLL